MTDKNILIVEDERIVAEDIRSRLINFGYSVQAIVSTIQNALIQINSNDINLVLLDIELEGPMDGIKLAEELNANYDIPVVYLTAHSDKDILDRAKKTEPFGFLIKPFEERELYSTIETALYKYGIVRETREREAWFSTTLTSIGDAVIAVDNKGRISFMNPVAENLTGWKQGDVKKSDINKIVHVLNEKDNKPVSIYTKKIFKTDKETPEKGNDLVLVSKDLRRTPIDYKGTPLRDKNQIIMGAVFIIHDITERKNAEDTIKESGEKLQKMFDSSPNAIFVTDLTGTIIECNLEAVKVFGFSNKNELLGTKSMSLMAHRENGTNDKGFQGMMKVGQKNDIEYCIRRDNGAIFPVDVSANLIRDISGNPTSMIIIAQDITERKTSEEALWASEERYRTLVENFSDAILIHSSGTISFINKAGVKLLKAENADQVSGKKLSDFLPPESTDIINTQIDRIKFENKKSPPLEGLLIRSDNTEVDVEFVAIPYAHKDQDSVISVIRDITSRKQLEEQLIQSQKMEAIGRLAGGIAHDFNNMLMAITGYSELVLGNLDENNDIRSDVMEILKAAERAASLTRQLLTFSRRQQLKTNVLDLNTVVLDVRKMLKPIIGEDIQIKTLLEEHIERINADPVLIEQIIMNLAINAHDAMPDGGEITITTENIILDERTCRLLPDSKPGNYVCLTISDTGFGMGQDIIQHIFEPFYSTKDSGKGTGLGLSVVYGCVKQHNGWISVFSEKGVGTTFKIYIPSFTIKHVDTIHNTAPFEKEQGKNEGILVVEDEKEVLEFVTRVLNDNGYRVFGASNSKEAFRLFEKHNNEIQLIFTDVILPGITGIKLVQELLSKKPGLPVIMTSGYSDEKSHWAEINNEGYYFLHKPYDLKSLFITVKNALTTE